MLRQPQEGNIRTKEATHGLKTTENSELSCPLIVDQSPNFCRGIAEQNLHVDLQRSQLENHEFYGPLEGHSVQIL